MRITRVCCYLIATLLSPLVGGCTVAGRGLPVDEHALVHARDFTPGVIGQLSPDTCRAHGGTVIDESQTQGPCRLGRVAAIYRCSENVLIARLQQSDDVELLQRPGGNYEAVRLVVLNNETRWVGEHLTLVSDQRGLRAVTASGTVPCDVSAAG